MGVSIQITRTVKDGHLTYKFEGNFHPIACGNLVESGIRDYFRKYSGTRTTAEGQFFRLIDRETLPMDHASLYQEQFIDSKGQVKKGAPSRDVKFLALKTNDQLYHALRDAERGPEAMKEEYQRIKEIMASIEDNEDMVLVELES